eukprot:1064085-Rhodomonas_salina.4
MRAEHYPTFPAASPCKSTDDDDADADADAAADAAADDDDADAAADAAAADDDAGAPVAPSSSSSSFPAGRSLSLCSPEEEFSAYGIALGCVSTGHRVAGA